MSLRIACDGVVVDQANALLRLCLQYAHEVGVGHRRERMVAHAAFAEQHIADEQVAFEDGALVVRERRHGDRERCADGSHQRIDHRADVADGRALEGGAVLEVDLSHALGLQPAQCLQRLVNR